jgi:hypothetical protein
VTIEGRVIVELGRTPFSAARVALVQPGDIERLLRGRPVAETPRLVSRIYSVCSTAQAHASVLALEDALGIAPDAPTTVVRRCLTDMESLREGTLRIGLDWPRLIGETPHASRLRDVVQLLPRLRAALDRQDAALDVDGRVAPDAAAARRVVADADTLLADLIFGERASDWLARLATEGAGRWIAAAATPAARVLALVIARGWHDEGQSDVTALGAVHRDALRTWLEGPAAHWSALLADDHKGVPDATLLASTLSDPALGAAVGRTPARAGLLTRLAARLVEIARLVVRLDHTLAAGIGADAADAIEPPARPAVHRPRFATDGIGIGRVAAARGTLVHAVEVEGGVVRRYRLLPPTVLNFDQDGVAARALSSVAAADEAQRILIAELLVSAIDPCVAHEVRFG